MKAETGLWQECLQVLGAQLSEKQPKKANQPDQSTISLESGMSLLRGKAHEALENRQHATHCYREALTQNLFCYEAFDALIGGSMLNSTQGKSF